MMHEPEKSNSVVVAEKPANKAEQSAAEPVEPRAETKGNMPYRNTLTRVSHSSGCVSSPPVKDQNCVKLFWITRKRRQPDWRFAPFFIDSKNSSDLQFRDGFAANSPLRRQVIKRTRTSRLSASPQALPLPP